MSTLNWQWLALHELDSAALYAVLEARQQVFVLEQQCLYADIDGEDQRAYHLLGWNNDGGPRQLLAYLRCFAPGVTYPETVLGRVLTVQSARGKGLGRQLMAEGIRRAEQHFPGSVMRISAQWHLERFYGEFGFAKASDSYLEDGIPHIKMLRK
ncbi:Putative acetyltransferase [Herminiimonas arsenicoxydans]|uniref:Acetyltransferase n=1 Tax=Herminiimonas arsenicoxydans TaxID=204773 RepID=A4GAE7_HERAR|nr:Putative acetyltransferase [Herminiimonas arsenicoxydans]